MFLHHILSREGDPLIKKVYFAQVSKTAKGDWCVVVKEDLDSIGLGYLDDEKIKCMKKDALKQLVTKKIKETALKVLQKAKGERKKLANLSYNELCMQPYLTPESKLSKEEKRVWFKWRTGMIKVQHNFGIKSLCPLCRTAEDTQEHLLLCPELSEHRCGDPTKDIISALRHREVIAEERKRSKKS